MENPEQQKDERIQSLESTVVTLNSRIHELEGKLQAAQNRPSLSSTATPSSQPARQNTGGATVKASVASNDPGAGFANDPSIRSLQQAKLLFDQEKYPEAILAYSSFLEHSPQHALAGSAQYAIGESYFLQGDFSVAEQEFEKVVVQHPRSPRVAHALARLSICSEKLGKPEEARRYRLQAEGLFPKAPALKESVPAKISTFPTQDPAAPIATAPVSPNAGESSAPEVGTHSSDLDAPPEMGVNP